MFTSAPGTPFTPADFLAIREALPEMKTGELLALRDARKPAMVPDDVMSFIRYHAGLVLATRSDAQTAEAERDWQRALRQIRRAFGR